MYSLLDGHVRDKDLDLINTFKGQMISDNKLSFFLGAGFSMSWNSDYPQGNQLFSITKEQSEEDFYKEFSFISIAEKLGVNWLESKDENIQNSFRDLKYQIDIYKKYPSLIPSFLDKFTNDKLEMEFCSFVRKRLEELVGEEEFSLKFDKTKLTARQKSIFSFFSSLSGKDSLSFITTNYDFIIDRLILHANISSHPIRGVYDKGAFSSRNWSPDVNECSLYKLNGGFEIFSDIANNQFTADYEKAKDKNSTPKLIVPSREQSYQDSYFKSVFLHSCNKLRSSDTLAFVGYSLPEDDYILRFMLSNFIDCSNSEEKSIFIIDYNEDAAKIVYERVKSLFPKLKSIYYYKKDFSSFCKEINECKIT